MLILFTLLPPTCTYRYASVWHCEPTASDIAYENYHLKYDITIDVMICWAMSQSNRIIKMIATTHTYRCYSYGINCICSKTCVHRVST